MLERTMSRYLSWAGFFVVGILVCGVIWDRRLLSVALAFTGLLIVVLTAIADHSRKRYGDRQVVIAYRQSRRVARLRALLKGGICCLFFLLAFLFFLY